MLPLGGNRFVTVRQFRGKLLIDIRQYYEDAKAGGALKPTPKGISLSREQYDTLKRVMPAVDKRVEEL